MVASVGVSKRRTERRQYWKCYLKHCCHSRLLLRCNMWCHQSFWVEQGLPVVCCQTRAVANFHRRRLVAQRARTSWNWNCPTGCQTRWNIWSDILSLQNLFKNQYSHKNLYVHIYKNLKNSALPIPWSICWPVAVHSIVTDIWSTCIDRIFKSVTRLGG